MSAIVSFFAQVTDDLITPRKLKFDASSRELTIVIGTAIIVSLLALIWAIFFRKRRRHHRHSHGQHHSNPTSGNPAAPLTPPSQVESDPTRRRRRRRRRKERPRNPTLAETGGLPPIRGEGPSPPPG
jgi:hypothetical protein